MLVFITGAESFVGRALVTKCHAAGLDVVGIDTVPSEEEGVDVADIRDPALPDLIPVGSTVVHLAAVSRDDDCRRDPSGAFDVNVRGTMNVASAAKARSADQLIFASTEWVYGDVANDEQQDEGAPIDITSMSSEYAVSKLVGEQVLRLGQYLEAVTVLRFGIIYGPRDGNFSAAEALLRAVMAEDEVTVGSVATARRFIHVDDIATGILASFGLPGWTVLNLSGDRLTTLGEVIAASASIVGKEVSIVESSPDTPSIRNPVNSRARQTLNWAPAYEIQSGLQTVFDHFSVVTG